MDVFTIELLDMQRHHRVLLGADVVKDLRIPMDLHRVQVRVRIAGKAGALAAACPACFRK